MLSSSTTKSIQIVRLLNRLAGLFTYWLMAEWSEARVKEKRLRKFVESSLLRDVPPMNERSADFRCMWVLPCETGENSASIFNRRTPFVDTQPEVDQLKAALSFREQTWISISTIWRSNNKPRSRQFLSTTELHSVTTSQHDRIIGDHRRHRSPHGSTKRSRLYVWRGPPGGVARWKMTRRLGGNVFRCESE